MNQASALRIIRKELKAINQQLQDALQKLTGRAPRRFWTPARLKKLRELYPDLPTPVAARKMGISPSTLNQVASRYGVRKSEAYMRGVISRFTEGGRRTQIKPGDGRGGIRSAAHLKAFTNSGKRTRFKKGNRPHTWKPIGTTRLSKDGYLQRKVSETGYGPRDWKFEHTILWEKHNGPVKKGFMVFFKDGNKANITIENLGIRTRAENMRLNTVHNYPEPVKDVIRMAGVLKRTINQRRKDEND